MMRYLIRNARLEDFDRIHALARILDTVNLPDDKEVLGKILQKSSDSFKGKILDPKHREYLFVLEDRLLSRIVGTSQIIAQHGTRELPHIFFEVSRTERYSGSLDRHVNHQVLRLGFNFDGPTEIGGLIVDPDYRHVPEKLGLQLSMIRFLFIAMNRQLFQDRLLAELLPPLTRDKQSILWDTLGKNFTGLEYHKADHYSRTNKEFIINLFPSGQIFTCLFSKEVQEVIGCVGKESVPAKKMLESIGFSYENRIDPFDGGPHLEAKTDYVYPVARSKKLRLMSDPLAAQSTMKFLVASFKNPFTPNAQFRSGVVSGILEPDGQRLRCSVESRATIDLADDEEVTVFQLP